MLSEDSKKVLRRIYMQRINVVKLGVESEVSSCDKMKEQFMELIRENGFSKIEELKKGSKKANCMVKLYIKTYHQANSNCEYITCEGNCYTKQRDSWITRNELRMIENYFGTNEKPDEALAKKGITCTRFDHYEFYFKIRD